MNDTHAGGLVRRLSGLADRYSDILDGLEALSGDTEQIRAVISDELECLYEQLVLLDGLSAMRSDDLAYGPCPFPAESGG